MYVGIQNFKELNFYFLLCGIGLDIFIKEKVKRLFYDWASYSMTEENWWLEILKSFFWFKRRYFCYVSKVPMQ